MPAAIVGHYHPERFWWYLRNQQRRAYDRIKVIRDHPEGRSGDNYTPGYTKYQIAAGGALLPSLLGFYPLFPASWLIPLAVAAVLLWTTLVPFPYLFSRDRAAACFSIPVQAARSLAWFVGAVAGLVDFGMGRKARKDDRRASRPAGV